MNMLLAVLLLLQLDVATLFRLYAAPARSHSCSTHDRVIMCAGDEKWDSSYMDELRQRILSSGSSAKLGRPHEVLHDLRAVWVLIFNPGKSDEGVYTLQGKMSSAASYVLAFEETDEAERFASLLHAEGFDLPQPMEWHAEQIRNFCETGQFELGIVPTGALLTPPTHNEYDAEAYGKMAYQQKRASEDLYESLGSSDGMSEQRKLLDKLFKQW